MESPPISRSPSLLFPLLVILAKLALGGCSPPEPVVRCDSGDEDCLVTNGYGAFADGTICRVAAVVYPTDEEELISAVSDAAKKKQHMKVVTAYSHSLPKLACPGGLDATGLVISTERLNKVVAVDRGTNRMTFQSGIKLRELIDAAAAEGLALPQSPYWEGMSLGGLLATGSQGSSLAGKGSAVHEYVVGMRLVVPKAPVNGGGGHADVVDLGEDDPDLLAAKVSLGVLGVVSQVTLQLEPMFKRSITFRVQEDAGLETAAIPFAMTTEFADIVWFAGQGKVVYRDDVRLPISAPGTGKFDFIGFRSWPSDQLRVFRSTEEMLEAAKNSDGKCDLAKSQVDFQLATGIGLQNNGGNLQNFTGYPVVGYNSDMQTSGSCLTSEEDNLRTACFWDTRVRGAFYYQTGASIDLAAVSNFIADVKKLRELRPKGLCGADVYSGIHMRFVRGSTAYLGKVADSVEVDISYYRSRQPREPRLDEDVLEEVEQMVLFKYGALPHWGKNRNLAFLGLREKYGEKAELFLSAMERYDPEGLFSSGWTDAVLGLRGRSVVVEGEGCALDGLCICSRDEHCAPAKGYFCRPGLVYSQARVCRRVEGGRTAESTKTEL